ncbi:MAG: PorP/SprF family type IX secretion system membrane protein [Flavobacteriales bacterium]|nr:PorP/SprF family type IX secretion system membrane protein [Flavobacteriales bacterium]
MKRSNLIKFLFVLIVSIPLSINAQDVHFSQFGQTPQLINPGASGVFNGNVRAILNYRNQWGAFGNAYNTFAASFDAPISKGNGRHAYFGLGVNFYKDVAGNSSFGNFQAGLSISGILPIADKHTFSVGIQPAFGQYSASLAKLTWGSQFNGEEFDTEINSNETFGFNASKYFDLGAGIFYEFKNSNSEFLGSDMSSFNIGVAGYHLNKPKQDFLSDTQDEIPMKIVAQFSGTFDMRSSKLSFVPSMFYAIQGPYREITPGLLFKIRMGNSTKYSGLFKQGAVYFGAHYRVKDAIIPQVYLEFSDYMLGISYDYNNSALSSVTGGNGGFEISIRYINRPKALQRASFK